MKKIKNMDLAELAAFICERLNKKGLDCVLTGGACVSIYTENIYESFDLDFIDRNFTPRKIITETMAELGFAEKNRYYKNPDTKYIIEFPPGPLSIGSQQIKKINELVYPTGKLLLLTPEDAVKDRLAAYFYWNDMQSFEQAKLIYNSQNAELNEIENWAKKEGQYDKFKKIINEFKK